MNALATVFINTPKPYRYLSWLVFVLMFCMVLFVIFAEFDEKIRVRGYLNSVGGMIRVYPPKAGVVVHCYVQLGQMVHRGDALFDIEASFSNTPALLKHLTQQKTLLQHAIREKKKTLTHWATLLGKKYITEEFYESKKESLRELRQRHHQLMMELLRYQQDQSYVIRATKDGVITSIQAQSGQYVDLNRPLLRFVPQHTFLVAELFLPVKNAAWLNKHNKLLLHYDAYPLLRFGAQSATIVSMEHHVLMDDEDEPKPLQIGEPYYKMMAHLKRQSMSVEGVKQPLHQGMLLTGVLIAAKKPLWRWMLASIEHYFGY